MKIDLRTLKLHPGKNEHFQLEAAGRDELLADLRACFLDPIQVSLEVSHQGRCFNGHGRLKTRVGLACSRCLEPLEWPVDRDFDFVVAPESEGGASSGDEDILYFGSGLVDIKPLMEELIIADMPLTPLCSEECLGLCPVCGSNKNTTKCSCRQDDIDPRWEKLKNI